MAVFLHYLQPMNTLAHGALLALTLAAAPSVSVASEPFAARVVGVADGDTITVVRDDVQQRVRLNGAACPEALTSV